MVSEEEVLIAARKITENKRLPSFKTGQSALRIILATNEI